MNVLGIGTEIVECVRIAKMIERHGEMFLERVYSPAEVEYCSQRSSASQHFAAHWAAKEAVMKAVGGRAVKLKWTDIVLSFDTTGTATVRLVGRAANWGQQLGIDRIQLSLGRCRTHATAFAMAIGAELP